MPDPRWSGPPTAAAAGGVGGGFGGPAVAGPGSSSHLNQNFPSPVAPFPPYPSGGVAPHSHSHLHSYTPPGFEAGPLTPAGAPQQPQQP
uniref:Uncharacterized protein n=1 Tax=Chromera velia CCMP2878 TaxID=1169474 RepID=A0A0G4I7X0_9ALVE|eukprot:Cvel_11785.t1-p1 / transcript=Cvel_11785.t1 / gene=Cvel_11785 / organism=Chromera_velia_CCMP2878 / gene_product=hypothetical protein / transcript_product=hypothetical protein / location=Cvel_scaffold749:61321-61584(+) / protein_length=88 / sequence_SO=supercontig / SO=protein_coding / is_pseudo=false